MIGAFVCCIWVFTWIKKERLKVQLPSESPLNLGSGSFSMKLKKESRGIHGKEEQDETMGHLVLAKQNNY